MIPEELQDQAALYVLGALEPNDNAAFEAALGRDAELQALVNDLREGAAALAMSVPSAQPSPALKQRVLRDIAIEKTGGGVESRVGSTAWLPWAIAAVLTLFAGYLAYDRMQLRAELSALRSQRSVAQLDFATLAPQKDAPPEAKAVVAWQPNEQAGVIRVSGLSVVPGKDYQLWAVDADHKDPISAGMLHVGADGAAVVRFKPVTAVRQVKAFAISLEREGGVTKAEGPIVLVGQTTS